MIQQRLIVEPLDQVRAERDRLRQRIDTHPYPAGPFGEWDREEDERKWRASVRLLAVHEVAPEHVEVRT